MVQWLLVAVASLVAEHRLQGMQASGIAARGLGSCSPGLKSAGSVALAHGLSCSEACGIFPDQGSNPCLSALAGRFFATEPPGKPQ